MSTISINKKIIGKDHRCFLIAEIGQAHDGSLGIAHSYIDAVAESGADAIKFQTHIAEAESTNEEKFRVDFSYEDVDRYNYWKRMEFTNEQWLGLKQHCDRAGIIFLSSPFSVEAVDLLNKIDVPAWKVGSGEINNPIILEEILKTSRPILLSTGMSNWRGIDQSVEELKKKKADFALFQCTSKYPASLKEVGLNIINEMQSKYDVPVGLSDHTGSTSSSYAAIANGANLIEFHVVFNKKMFGPDVQSSIDFNQLDQIVKFRDEYFEIKKHPVDKDKMANELSSMKTLFGRSLVTQKPIKKGAIIKKDDLTAKKPGTGILVEDIYKCIGKRINNDLNIGHFLRWTDFES